MYVMYLVKIIVNMTVLFISFTIYIITVILTHFDYFFDSTLFLHVLEKIFLNQKKQL